MQYFISVVQEIGAGISSSLLLFVLTLIFSMPLGCWYVLDACPKSSRCPWCSTL